MEVFYSKSIQGESHKMRSSKEGREFPCQDRSYAEQNIRTKEGSLFNLLMVADGHGSDRHFRSAKGAEIALDEFKYILINDFKIVEEFARTKDFASMKNYLVNKFVQTWEKKVFEDLEKHPVTSEEYENLAKYDPDYVSQFKAGQYLKLIYGTTFIAVVFTKTFWLGIQIGDGDLVISDNGKSFSKPVPDDERCYLNITSSLCDENSECEFRYAYGFEIPRYIFLTTDGVINTFLEKEIMFAHFHKPISEMYQKLDFEDLNMPCKNCHSCKNPLDCYVKACNDLVTKSLPHVSKGSLDDVSLAMYANVGLSAFQFVSFKVKKNEDIKIAKKNNISIGKKEVE